MTLDIRNYTPFVPFAFEKQGKGGINYEVVIIKGTFDLTPGKVKIAADQKLPVMADQYYGEPGTSSLAMEADLVPFKPATDIYVTGHAHRPSQAPAYEWLAEIAIAQTQTQDSAKHKAGDILTLRSTLHLCGPRFWECSLLGGWRLGKPEATSSIALKYELAFGGQIERRVKVSEQHPTGIMMESYAPNPVGVGYYDIATMKRDQRYQAPSILSRGQTIDSLGDRPAPAGTTPISRWWPQRYRYAGTYDRRWERTWQDEQGKPLAGVFPALPEDFDNRFYNAAPLGLTWPGWLQGDETLQVRGFLPGGDLQTSLMGLRMLGLLQGGKESGRGELFKLDTLHIDLDARRVILTWRLTVLKSLEAERLQIMFANPDEGYNRIPDDASQARNPNAFA